MSQDNNKKHKQPKLRKIKPVKSPKPAQAMPTANREKRWFRIDNAGLIFIPASTRKWTCTFRVAAVLKEPVDPKILQQAVTDLTPRFPAMMVYSKAGMFWNYLESAQSLAPRVQEDTLYPCQRFDLRSKRYLVRILYQGHRISFECFHAISDGTGGFAFLNSLLRRYFELSGKEITGFDGCKDYKDLPAESELEDSFQRYAKIGKSRKYSDRKALQLQFEPDDFGVLNVLHCTFDLRQLKEQAKSYSATVGEFLTACLFYSIYQEVTAIASKKPKKFPLKISIPIDLRRKYPSHTVRNFSSYMNMAIDHTAPQTFERIVELTKKQYCDIDIDYLFSSISTNVTRANHPLVRLLPLPLKNTVLKIGYNLLGEKLTTMTFSNIGVLKTPPEFAEHIERYEFLLGPLKVTAVNAACVCFGDKVVLSLSSRAKNTNLEKRIIRTFLDQGLAVRLDTNRRECNND